MKQTIWGAKQVHVGYCRAGAAAGFLVDDGLDAGGPWDVDERGARVKLRRAGPLLAAAVLETHKGFYKNATDGFLVAGAR